MRILLIMDPLIPVPPAHYGGIERIVADLADGLTGRGHDVTLWAAPGSGTAAACQPFGRVGEWTAWSNLRNTATLAARFVSRRGDFDVVHNFGRLAYLAPILRAPVPKVQTYMRPVDASNIRLTARVGARALAFTAVSDAIRRTGAAGGGSWHVVYNCARPSRYTPRYDVDPQAAPLMFLGRLERCKGAHTAIAVAQRLGRRLIVAGNISELPHEREYFHREIEPHLTGGGAVEYIGPIGDREKNDRLGAAAALLSPVEWEEPFPLIIPESLLCGTPVIAFRRGGMPEGIDDGRTGFLCDDADGMVASVQRLGTIDRRVCRTEGERRFSDDAVIGEYVALYQRMREA